MKRIIVKMSFVLLLVLTVAGRKETEVSAKIKTKKITIDLRGGNTAASEPEMVRKAKKVFGTKQEGFRDSKSVSESKRHQRIGMVR